MVDAVEDCKLSAPLDWKGCVSFISQSYRTAIDSSDETTDKSDENRLQLIYLILLYDIPQLETLPKRITENTTKSILTESHIN